MENFLKYLAVYLLICITTFILIGHKVYNKPDSILSVQLAMEKDDDLTVYYRSTKEELSEERTVVRSIKGQAALQTIQFNIPANSNSIRFDLGQNKQQGNISIKEIALNHIAQNKIKRLGPKNILRYFKVNNFIEKPAVVSNRLQIKPKSVNGQYDPYFNEVKIKRLLE